VIYSLVVVSKETASLFLGVVDFSKEVVIGVGQVSVLLQPQRKNGPVDNEKDSQKTCVVNSEPFISSLSGKCGRGGQNGRDGSGNSGHDASIAGSAQGSCRCLGDESCEQEMSGEMVHVR
jgi:hypothetical protein